MTVTIRPEHLDATLSLVPAHRIHALRRCIANFEDRGLTDRKFAIYNEYGLIAIAYADHEQEALDAACDAGKLEGQMMSEEDYAEYMANGWDDSYMHVGNASEPIWSEYLSIREIVQNRRGTPTKGERA
jgi:hypothetical protein